MGAGMKVTELMALLMRMPLEAEVYVSEPSEDDMPYTERDPFVTFEQDGTVYFGKDGKSHPAYPAGRVKL